MVHCAVVGCSSRSNLRVDKVLKKKKNSRFFKIPKIRLQECEKTRLLSTKRRSEWIARLKRADLDLRDLDKYKVCSKHFLSGVYPRIFPVHFIFEIW